MNLIKRYTAIGLAMMLMFAVYSCKEEEEEILTTQVDSFSAETVTKMTSISNSFVPGSMATSTVSASMHGNRMGDPGEPLYDASSDDPCSGTDLFGCQPRLVKLYIANSKYMFDTTVMMLNVLSTALGTIPDGGSGSFLMDGTNTLHYSKISDEQWSLLFVSPTGTFLDVSADANDYTLKMDMAKSSDASSDDTGQFEMQVSYTSDTAWSITSTMIGQACNVADIRAPDRIRIVITRTGEIYTGKAMLYSPRWAYPETNEPTCQSAATDDMALNLFTDFVANDAAAKVEVYMMKRTVSDLSTIGDYDMNNLCDFYFGALNQPDPASCVSAFQFWVGMTLSDYANPFCTTGPDHASWGDPCTDLDATIADAAFSSAGSWTLPSQFYLDAITFRSTLD